MKVAQFITESKSKDLNPIQLGFTVYHCSLGSLQKKVLPKVRRHLQDYDQASQIKLTHRTLLRKGKRGVKYNYHVVSGTVGSTPFSLVLDNKYKEL